MELVGTVLEAASGLTSAEDRVIALTEAAQVRHEVISNGMKEARYLIISYHSLSLSLSALWTSGV